MTWKIDILENLSKRVIVGIATSVTSYYRKKGVPIIRNLNIKPNKLDESDILYIDSKLAEANKSKAVRFNDVLTVRTGNVGQACLVPKHLDNAQTFTTLIITTDPNKLDPGFLCHHINSRLGQKQINRLTGDSGRGNLNAGELANYVLEVPPLFEQRKIAHIIGLWDKSIELTQNLINAKARLKRGLAQQLLTGKKRFREFVKSDATCLTQFGTIPRDWLYVEIGTIANEISKKNISKKDLIVLSCTKYQGLVDSLTYFGKRVFSEDTSSYKIVRRGNFAYATNHIEEGSIGYQNICDEALISPMYTVFETNEQVDHSFFYKLMKTELYRHIFESNTSGSIDRRGSLRWKDFAKIKVALPSLDEQRKIADVLNACDKEIELLNKQLEAIKKQKQGLMQKLLTGQIRVM